MHHHLTRILFLLLLTGSIDLASAQDIMRLELDGSDLSLPYYTITTGANGLVVFRGKEVKGKRVTGWELIHYDTQFKELNKNTLSTERGEYFAGWKTDDTCVYLLFLQMQSGFAGEVICYNFRTLTSKTHSFNFPDIVLTNPEFVVSASTFYLIGINSNSSQPPVPLGQWLKGVKTVPELVILSGTCRTDSIAKRIINIPDMQAVMHVQPDQAGFLLLLRMTVGKYMFYLQAFRFQPGQSELINKGGVASIPEKFIADLCFVHTDSFPLALAGTYGRRDKRAWNSEEPVFAEGLFFAPLDTGKTVPAKYFPFSNFKHLAAAQIRSQARNNRDGGKNRRQKGNMTFRVLLHETPYLVNGNLILVGETYYPEYEYQNQAQNFYLPYSYYGYSPGFYDSGGRWVFMGFRYEYAVVAAFDTGGNLVWENGFEASNILDKNLTYRLNLLAYANELVLVYANEGQVWFRIIRESEVVVEQEHYPVDLPSVSDRVKAHYGMNMMRWYDNYFLVVGRQTIRSMDGRTRTVYYCNKMAFE